MKYQNYLHDVQIVDMSSREKNHFSNYIFHLQIVLYMMKKILLYVSYVVAM